MPAAEFQRMAAARVRLDHQRCDKIEGLLSPHRLGARDALHRDQEKLSSIPADQAVREKMNVARKQLVNGMRPGKGKPDFFLALVRQLFKRLPERTGSHEKCPQDGHKEQRHGDQERKPGKRPYAGQISQRKQEQKAADDNALFLLDAIVHNRIREAGLCVGVGVLRFRFRLGRLL